MATYTNIPVSGGSAIGPGGTWARDQYTFLSGLVPQLTGFQYIRAGQYPPGAPAGAIVTTNDGAVEGGGRTGTNATVTYLSSSVYQTCNTGKFGFSFKATFLAAGAGQSNAVGLANAAASHNVFIGALNAISGTNYGLDLTGTTGTTDDLGVANDLAVHTFSVTGDATNVRAYIDGTLRGTRVIGTNVVNEPLYLCLYNTLSTETVVHEIVYGYVAP